jgi:hypothetical protein
MAEKNVPDNGFCTSVGIPKLNSTTAACDSALPERGSPGLSFSLKTPPTVAASATAEMV